MKNKLIEETKEQDTESSSSDYDSDDELDKILTSLDSINPSPLVRNHNTGIPLNVLVRQHRLNNWIFQPVNSMDYDISRIDY